MSAVLFDKNFDMRKSFLNIEKDPDFTLLRNDERYLFLKGMVSSENFDDVVVVLENQAVRLRKVIEKINPKETVATASVKELGEIRKNINGIYTVAPMLIEIQKKGLDYIDRLIRIISSNSVWSPEAFKAGYQEIIQDVQAAKASQHTLSGQA